MSHTVKSRYEGATINDGGNTNNIWILEGNATFYRPIWFQQPIPFEWCNVNQKSDATRTKHLMFRRGLGPLQSVDRSSDYRLSGG